MEFLKALWRGFSRVMMVIGDTISTIVLVVLYCTVFALFAIPCRLAADFLHFSVKDTNFVPPRRQFTSLSSVSHEG